MKLLFHIHTKHSYDSFLSLKSIIDYAKGNGFSIVAITDHDTINGSLAASAYARKKKSNVEVVIGAEYLTDCGDIIGVLLKEDIIEKDAVRLIYEIHRQGGIAILPHPFHKHTLSNEMLQRIDVIEVFNARCSKDENEKAYQLAKEWDKPMICGNDAHLACELSLCYNVLTSGADLATTFKSISEMHKQYSSKTNIIRSQIIKGIKNRDMALILRMLRSIFSVIVMQPLRKM